MYLAGMLQRTLPAGFISPCLPTKTDKLPAGSGWLHEIKHDGFRVIARKKGAQVRLYSRPGNDLTYRFPLIVETLARLRSRSCIIDGEAVACDDDGVTSFDRVRYRHHDESIFLYDCGFCSPKRNTAILCRAGRLKHKSLHCNDSRTLFSFSLLRSAHASYILSNFSLRLGSFLTRAK
jgi:hypothetical protein